MNASLYGFVSDPTLRFLMRDLDKSLFVDTLDDRVSPNGVVGPRRVLYNIINPYTQGIGAQI